MSYIANFEVYVLPSSSDTEVFSSDRHDRRFYYFVIRDDKYDSLPRHVCAEISYVLLPCVKKAVGHC